MTDQSQNEYTKQGHIVRNIYEKEVWNLAIEAAATLVDNTNEWEEVHGDDIRKLKK